MSEETNQSIGTTVTESEPRNSEGCVTNNHHHEGLVGSHDTGKELPEGFREGAPIPVEESPMTESQEDLVSSHMESYQSLPSSQSSEEGIREAKMIPYVSPPKTTETIHFEDTLSDENHCQFNLIYEYSLIERKAGGLAIGMVLAGKPPAWLPVICERLKHLIISSEAFQEKRRIEYNAQNAAKKTKVW